MRQIYIPRRKSLSKLYNGYAVKSGPYSYVSDIRLGYLYTWPAAVDSRKITSSDAWNVPSTTEYQALITLAASNSYNLRETGTVNWLNNYGNDSLGFTGRGAGCRSGASFYLYREYSYLWTRTPGTSGKAYVFFFHYGDPTISPQTQIIYSGFGGSIRLLRDATLAELELANGSACGSYIQNDGTEIPTVKIGTKVFTKYNIVETLFRNGDSIPEVTGSWAGLTTPARCSFNNDESLALTRTTVSQPVLAIDGWHIPSIEEWTTLSVQEGSHSAMNFKFNGIRLQDGNFESTPAQGPFWSSSEDGDSLTCIEPGSSDWDSEALYSKKSGIPLRLIKDDSVDTETVTDMDSNTYQSVKIGEQVWLTEDFRCTHYNDGTLIPNVTDNTEWSELETGAMCTYNNI